MPATGIPITDLADLLNMTQKNLDVGKWTDISYDLQKHVAVANIIGDTKMELQSGTSIQFNVVTDTAGTAEPTRPHHKVQPRFADVTTKGEVAWRAHRAHYAWSELEMDLNRPPSQIVELLKIRRNGLWIDCAGNLEQQFWSKPASSSNTTDWFGLPYWCPKWAALASSPTTVSLQGGNPVGFTSGAAGISSTTYPQWNNWAAQYTALSEDDGIDKMATMYRFMQYTPPPRVEEYNRGEMRLMIACCNATYRDFEKFARSQNDSLGFDVIPTYNMATFYKTPITWVPYLENDATSAPIYFIDYSVFQPVFLAGYYMKLYPITVAADTLETLYQYLMWVGNFVCKNRRRLGVLSKLSSTDTSS